MFSGNQDEDMYEMSEKQCFFSSRKFVFIYPYTKEIIRVMLKFLHKDDHDNFIWVNISI